MKFSEDLTNLNEPREVSAEDITTAKKNTIKYLLNMEDLDLDNLNDEELDQLLGRTQTMQEKASEIANCIKIVGGDIEDQKEALKVHMGLKLEEAENILKDCRING